LFGCKIVDWFAGQMVSIKKFTFAAALKRHQFMDHIRTESHRKPLDDVYLAI